MDRLGLLRPLAACALALVVLLGWSPAARAELETRAAAPAFIPTGSDPQSFVDLHERGVTVFWASFKSGKADLWSTDGTAAGTGRLLACPSGCPSFGSEVAVATGSVAHLWLPNSRGGADLWRTDGTGGGTVRLSNFGPDTFPGGKPTIWSPALGRLVFTIHNLRTGGSELWASDGTAAGTRRIVAAGPKFSGPLDGLHDLGGRVAFSGSREAAPGQPLFDLWTTDGTAGGTAIAVTIATADYRGPTAVLGERAIFATAEVGPVWSDCRVDLWTSGGSPATTEVFASFRAAGVDCRDAPPSFQILGDVALFSSRFSGDDELWATDGTAGGTRPLTDFDLRPARPAIYSAVTEMGGELYFAADDGIHGIELWKARLDAPISGAALVADLCTPPVCSSLPTGLVAIGDLLYFQAGGFYTPQPWMSDGTDAGTVRRPGFCDDCLGPFLPHQRVGDDLYFVGGVRYEGAELFVTRGATGYTELLTDLQPVQPVDPGTGGSRGTHFLFPADDATHGRELWISDGTRAGTRLLVDLATDGATPGAPPPTPTHVTSSPAGMDSIRLGWQPVSGAKRYRVQVRQPIGPIETTVEGAGASYAHLTNLSPGSPTTVRIRAENDFGGSAWSRWVSSTTLSAEPGEPCLLDGDSLCLRNGRFRIEVDWRDQRSGAPGIGRTLPSASTDRSGTFWFFRPDNVELIVKVLDGTSVNAHWWTFYGALTDVEYWITVTDVVSQASRTYYNPPGQVCGLGDTASLGAVTAGSSVDGPTVSRSRPREVGVLGPLGRPVRAADASGPSQACLEDGKTLCLLGGRFRARVEWSDQHNGGAGSGDAVPFADRTGFFTFFNPHNVELVVKVLDGMPVNGKIWVFYGALSDVEYTLTVEDLFDGGAANEYHNPPGNLCGYADTSAF